MKIYSMRQVPLECVIIFAVNGPFLVRNLHQERPFMAILISRSRGTCLITELFDQISLLSADLWIRRDMVDVSL